MQQRADGTQLAMEANNCNLFRRQRANSSDLVLGLQMPTTCRESRLALHQSAWDQSSSTPLIVLC